MSGLRLLELIWFNPNISFIIFSIFPLQFDHQFFMLSKGWPPLEIGFNQPSSSTTLSASSRESLLSLYKCQAS